MLIIYANGALLHHSYLNDRYNSVYDKHLKTEVNKAGSFEFTISSSHKLYDSLERFKTKIQVWMNDTLLFDGRVLEINETITKERKVYCEGNLAYLLDSLSAPYTGTMTVGDYLRKRIQEHNAQVGTDKQFTVRNIDSDLANKNVDVDETGYQDTRADIEANILNIHRGFLRTENQNGVLYLDYLKEDTDVGNQPMIFGFNLTDYTKNTPSTDVYTIMLPTGDDGLTIETVNNGSKYIENQTLIDKFGRIYHNQQFNGITSAAELLSEATTYFNLIADVLLTPTFSVKLADVSNWITRYTPPIAGKKYKLSGPDGELYVYQAYSIDYDFDEIGNTTIEFTSPDTTYASTHRRGSSVGKGSGSGTSKRSGSSGNASGINLKYYHEGNDSAKIIASDIGLESSSTHISVKDKFSVIASESDYADFIENGGVGSILEVDHNGFRSITGVLKSAFGKFKGGDGTGILQNIEAITQFAGNFTVDSEGIVRLKDGASLMVKKDGIYSLVGTENEMASAISQTKSELRSDVYAANSSLYSYIQQTASSLSSTIEDTENGLYSYIQQTASGIRQTLVSGTNRTIVNDTDPRGETYAPKDGDIWIESTYQGSWDGAEGFDWEHDEDYDWTQVQGAKVWTWKNDRWQLVADRQQLVNYSDFVNTAEMLISQKITKLANDEGQLEVYRSLLEQTGQQIRAEVYSATSDIYSYVHQTASNLHIALGGGARVVTQDGIKDGEPRFVDEHGDIRVKDGGYVLRDGDIWVNSANQDTWDKAINWNWNDDTNYNWSDLRDDEIRVWDGKTKEWKEVVNGRVFTDELELDIANDHIIANMRSIDAVDKKNEENMHQLSITTEELRSTFNDRITGVNSELRQTKNDLTSLQAETIRTSQWQTWYEGTGIFQNRENINAVAGKFKVDANGNVHVIDGSGLYLGEGNASLGVYTSGNLTAGIIVDKINGGTVKITGAHVDVTARDRATWGVYDADTLTAGIIVDKINGGSVTIQANKINLNGYVTASQLESTNAAINNLVSGNTSASKLVASNGNFSNLEITNALTYGGYGDLKKKIINGFSSSASGGTITITSTTLDGTAGPSVNFNIADTQYYKDGVAAAKNSVNVTKTWEDNVCSCMPSAGTGTGQTITITQSTANPTTAAPNLYRVTIKDGNTQVLYFTVDASARYNAGSTAGYNSGYADGVNDGYATGYAAAGGGVEYNDCGSRYWGYSTNGGATWNWYYSGTMYTKKKS